MKIFVLLGVALLTGCATNSKMSLPTIQQQVKDRSNLMIAWPQTESERNDIDKKIETLLSNGLTVASAVQIAVLNNRSLRATFEDLGISEADVIQAGKLPNPSFGASVRWPNQRPRGPNVQLSLEEDILEALLLPLKKNFANERLAQAQRRVVHEVLELVEQVNEAAWTVIARDAFRERLVVISQSNEAAADLARRQYNAGNINRLELLNQQTSAQQSHLELVQTEAQLRADRERVNRLLGLWGKQTDWKMTEVLRDLPEKDPELADVESVAISRRMDLAALRSDVTLAASALKLKTSTRYFPAAVNLGVDTERDPAGGRVTGPTLNLAIPIFDQGQGELARLRAVLRQARDQYEGLAIDIRSEAREARDALIANRGAAEYYEKVLVPQRENILKETLLHYNAMQKSPYELLLAKEREQAAERDGIDAIRDYWIARAKLERALGTSINGALEKTAANQPGRN